jgi:hypothetical protein
MISAEDGSVGKCAARTKQAFVGASIIAVGAFFSGLLPGAGIGAAVSLVTGFVSKQKCVNYTSLAKAVGTGAFLNGIFKSATFLNDFRVSVPKTTPEEQAPASVREQNWQQRLGESSVTLTNQK